MLCEKLRNAHLKLPNTAKCTLEAAQHCIVQDKCPAAPHAAKNSLHSTAKQLYKSGQVSLKDRYSLAYMGLYKAA